MNKILISSCLLGNPVRYDGGHKQIKHNLIAKWQAEGRLVSLCPEVAGGLPTPRLPAEINDTKVVTSAGENVTNAFSKGAELTLTLCQKHQISIAILKESSPSCGSQRIYDGSFANQLVAGEGLTARLLKRHGIRVFNETQLDEVEKLLRLSCNSNLIFG